MGIEKQVGQRLKAALYDSGLSATEAMKQLGYTGKSTLDRWFKGQSQPSFKDIQDYGVIVGKPFSWFFQIDPESEDVAAFVVDCLVSTLYRMLSGEDPGDALSGELGDPNAISPSVRRMLTEATDVAREELVSLTDGFLDLPPAEQRRRLRRIVNSYLEPEI